jgi:hypothetical protein
VALHHPPAADAPVLHNAESPVLLAVLPPNLRAQKHAQRLAPSPRPRNRLGRHYSRFQATRINKSKGLRSRNAAKIAVIHISWCVGLGDGGFVGVGGDRDTDSCPGALLAKAQAPKPLFRMDSGRLPNKSQYAILKA